MIEFLDAAEIGRRVPPAAAVQAIRQALRDDLDPAADPARTIVDVPAGQLLLMPSSSAAAAGVKLATVAPGNAARGRPRVQALYVLLDAETLTPQAILDGTALTTLRTPAVSVAAVQGALPERPSVVVFGAGPQGRGHVATLAAVAGALGAVTYVVRDPSRALRDPLLQSEVTTSAIAKWSAGTATRDRQADGQGGEQADGGGGSAGLLRAGEPAVEAALRGADVVVCATTARTPLFDSALLAEHAVVIAVGSHEPDARELDAALFARSQVIVEDQASALREAGDIVLAIAEGTLDAGRLIPLRDVVTGEAAPATDRPVVFKGTGMAWQDLVVARAVSTLH